MAKRRAFTPEEEWFRSGDAREMLGYLPAIRSPQQRAARERKLRLFGCASCRLFDADSLTGSSRDALEFTERLADGEVTADQMIAIASAAELTTEELPATAYPPPGASWRDWPVFGAIMTAARLPVADAGECAQAHWAVGSSIPQGDRKHAEWISDLRTLSNLLRDIFGNPFRPVAFQPAWRTSDVLALANGIYAERAFDRMPILADALQDAGCDNPDILGHCRDPQQVHVRGCWVVDLVLGKS